MQFPTILKFTRKNSKIIQEDITNYMEETAVRHIHIDQLDTLLLQMPWGLSDASASE